MVAQRGHGAGWMIPKVLDPSRLGSPYVSGARFQLLSASGNWERTCNFGLHFPEALLPGLP